MAVLLTATAPVAELTPQNAGGSPTSRPPLEVITMPMWLWVDNPGEMQTVVTDPAEGGPTEVSDTVVIDEVQWYLDGSATAWQTCGDRTQPIFPTPTTPDPADSGPGVPYGTDMDPSNGGDAQPLACVLPHGFATPFYQPTTVSGSPATVDGVHSLTAQVYWHVIYKLTQPQYGYVLPNGFGQAQAMNVTPLASNRLTFRVGEIQALVTKP
jgi:hypothetical protein